MSDKNPMVLGLICLRKFGKFRLREVVAYTDKPDSIPWDKPAMKRSIIFTIEFCFKVMSCVKYRSRFARCRFSAPTFLPQNNDEDGWDITLACLFY